MSAAGLPADQKEFAELDRQIEAKEKELAELRKKADSLRANVGVGRTWVEIDHKVYGAKPDERGRLGGGPGYTGIVRGGRYRVSTLDQLLVSLKKANKGDVIFIDGSHRARDAVAARDKTRVFDNAYGPTDPALLDPAQ